MVQNLKYLESAGQVQVGWQSVYRWIYMVQNLKYLESAGQVQVGWQSVYRWILGTKPQILSTENATENAGQV